MMYLGPVIGLVLAFLLCESSISSQIDSNSTQLIRRIAFGSCFNPNRGSNIWNLMGSHGPHQIILLGDQFYADREVNWMRRKPTLSLLKQEYELWTSSSEWHALASSVEDWISVYDDHDYGLNNGDRTFELRNESMKLFHQYNSKFDPFLPGTMVPKEGVFDSRVVHLANEGLDFTYKIVLVDVRSAKESQGPSRTLLGSQQWTWLEAELSPQALQGVDLVLVGSPIQILPDDKLIEERWSEFPDERQRLLELISSVHSQTNVLLLSGDIHSAEISRVKCSAASSAEFQIVELTSSGLSHSFLHRAIPNGLEDDEAIAFTSHGWLAEFVGALYQAIYPGHFQLLKFADTYRFMHFALLDFVINPETSALELIFRVINFRGEEVMTRSFPLPKKSSIYADRPSYSVTCDPVRGPVPLWRHLLLRAVVAALILLVLVLPALGILYLACMSIFYIFVGKELRRRETLEHRYQSLSQPSLHAHAD